MGNLKTQLQSRLAAERAAALEEAADEAYIKQGLGIDCAAAIRSLPREPVLERMLDDAFKQGTLAMREKCANHFLVVKFGFGSIDETQCQCGEMFNKKENYYSEHREHINLLSLPTRSKPAGKEEA